MADEKIIAKNDDDDLEVPGDSGKKQFKKYSKSIGTKYDIHLPGSIYGDPLEFAELLDLLSSADSADIIRLRLDHSGGDADAGLRLARCIRQCKATTIVIVEQTCYSAGAVIALSGDYLTMHPGTMLMFHNWSGGSFGKGGEMKQSLREWDNAFWRQCCDIVCPFLTQTEVRQLQQDKDVYVQAPSEKHFTKKQKEENDKLLNALTKRVLRHFPHMRG